MSHHRSGAPTSGSTRPMVRRFAALGLVLVLLYYLVSSLSLIRELHQDVLWAQEVAVATETRAAAERTDLEERLDALQAELEAAREEVQALRQQLEDAGLSPVSLQDAPVAPEPVPAPGDTTQPAPEAPAAPSGSTAGNPAPPPADPAPEPAPIDPGAPVPAPTPQQSILGGTPLVCVGPICL